MKMFIKANAPKQMYIDGTMPPVLISYHLEDGRTIEAPMLADAIQKAEQLPGVKITEVVTEH